MIVLGLGSNCGDRLAHLRRAIQILRSKPMLPVLQVLAISPLYESAALLPENCPESWNLPYINFNALCETQLSPHELLAKLKNIEQSVGRAHRGRWAPREIDIDILIWDDQIVNTETLKIPHPSLSERPFVMLPLADLCPNWKSPLTQSHLQGTISDQVSHWKGKSDRNVPFQTHRSHHHLLEVVGILNITPDSFSDGAQWIDPEKALTHAREMIAQGVSILDIGAESTRPATHASIDQKIDQKMEWTRLEPVLAALAELKAERANQASPSPHPNLRLSIDTRHPETAQRALAYGVDWINDVSGFSNPQMREVVANSSADLVCMHSITIPPTPTEVLSNDKTPIQAILDWAEERIKVLEDSGISRERLIIDPGIGFGKTIEQNWELLRSIRSLKQLGLRTLVGHSRKSFLSRITQKTASNRDIETLSLSMQLATQGVNFLRVHQTEFHLRALKAWTQMDGVIH